MYFIIGWLAYLDSEAFEADKGEKDHSTYNGFGNWDDKESEDIEDDQAEEASAAAGWPEHGGVELATLDDDYDKYTFSKVLQFSVSKLCFSKDSQVQKHVLSPAFANMLWQKYLGFPGFASFHKYDFAGLAFASFHTFPCKYDLARFCNL